jgi:hypothetical protein
LADRVNINPPQLPVGRMVMGSLYKGSTTDAEGKPLVIKNGPNAGQSRTNFFFALAIPKGAEQHWAETSWGAIIWAVGHKAFPQAAQSPSFAWKIENGDSAVPNKRGRKPCDNEGWKGHWILKFSGGFAPKVYRPDASGMVQVMEVDYVKPGYFIEVAGTVDGNGSQSQPGIYLNHSMICLRGYGPEIVFGPDVNEAGFGQSALPAGASMTPAASTVPMPVPVPSATVAAAPPPPIPVQPNPQFLQVPANPSSPAAIPAIPPSPAVAAAPPTPPPPAPASPSSGPQMTAKAAGASYQAFISAGWTQANLIAEGYMTMG